MSELALKRIRECKETRSKRLDLGNCGLTELPDELFELTWLEELYLYQNPNLKNIDKTVKLVNLDTLYLDDSQLLKINIPKEIIKSGFNDVKNYLIAKQSISTSHINEAKLFIIGAAGVGKTFLKNSIAHGISSEQNYFVEKIIPTHGIDINKTQIVIGKENPKTIDLNIWELRNYDLENAYNHFFFNRRSRLYSYRKWIRYRHKYN
ncbi:MAG: hypothetical protein JNL70_25755 [Saprospiraceae bacterium]|nr:hypothetical protein [Saprospiraceae bacterium]